MQSAVLPQEVKRRRRTREGRGKCEVQKDFVAFRPAITPANAKNQILFMHEDLSHHTVHRQNALSSQWDILRFFREDTNPGNFTVAS